MHQILDEHSWFDAAKSTLPAFAPGETHLWRVSLNQPGSCLSRLKSYLSEDETARAARFYFEKDRVKFTIARGALRDILSRYTGNAPEDLRFSYGERGKPFLRTASVRFNISHSGALALYVISPDREVGIDIEACRENISALEIAEHFFSESERVCLRKFPPQQQIEAFYNCWTRKEAYIKAKGDGLYLALDAFDVSFAPGRPARLLETRGDPEEAARWTLHALDAPPGYAAALAIEAGPCSLKKWDWRPPL